MAKHDYVKRKHCSDCSGAYYRRYRMTPSGRESKRVSEIKWEMRAMGHYGTWIPRSTIVTSVSELVDDGIVKEATHGTRKDKNR